MKTFVGTYITKNLLEFLNTGVRVQTVKKKKEEFSQIPDAMESVRFKL